MIYLKRFPSLVYRYKGKLGAGILLALAVIYLLHHFGYVCMNRVINEEIDKLCNLYGRGKAVGNLCKPLCHDKHVHSMSCTSRSSGKRFQFKARWNQKLVVIKSAEEKDGTNHSAPDFKSGIRMNSKTAGEANEEVEKYVRNLARERFNMSLTRDQVDSLAYLDPNNKNLYAGTGARGAEIRNVVQLLRSREYVYARLFHDREIFPRILGTCGHLYAIEHIETPSFDSVSAPDNRAEWSERMKLAVAIMDFVEEAETSFPDALHFCDMDMSYLGVTKLGRIKFLDLDMVYLKNVVDKKVRTRRRCTENSDCDLNSCKSVCDEKEKICDSGVTNDNLQVVCEKIFIGWTMSGKVLVPGLLMSEHTPASLSALLRLCADSGRRPVPEDLRQRLYTTLVEMHQILSQKIFSN